MSKFSIKSVSSKVKVPSRKTILILAGSAIVLAILLGAMVYQVRAERHRKAVEATQAAQQADKEAKLNARVTQLEASNKALQADKQLLCANYTSLSTARATRSLVVVPTNCAIKR